MGLSPMVVSQVVGLPASDNEVPLQARGRIPRFAGTANVLGIFAVRPIMPGPTGVGVNALLQLGLATVWQGSRVGDLGEREWMLLNFPSEFVLAHSSALVPGNISFIGT